MSNTVRATKIAIIEDDDSIRALYQYKFEHAGYTVVSAENGSKGLEVIKDSLPDLILLDLRMPEMGGDEMLERLRSESWGAAMRVIVMTNISKDEAPSNLRFLGVDRYIVKAHYTPTQVLSTVREVLGKK